MQTHDSDDRESTGLDERDVRALEQYLTVLPDAPDLFEVVSESGSSYTVDVRDGCCSCKDFEYRAEELGPKGCKHMRRVAYATGARPLPDGVDRDDLPADFGRHVEPDENAGKPLAADGGEILKPEDGAEILEPDPEWSYHVEPAEQGGEEFVRW